MAVQVESSEREPPIERPRKYAVITALNQTQSPFLRLPPELRNKIYELVPKEAVIQMQKYITGRPKLCQQRPKLVLVSYQIHLESWSIFSEPTTVIIRSDNPGLSPYWPSLQSMIAAKELQFEHVETLIIRHKNMNNLHSSYLTYVLAFLGKFCQRLCNVKRLVLPTAIVGDYWTRSLYNDFVRHCWGRHKLQVELE